MSILQENVTEIFSEAENVILKLSERFRGLNIVIISVKLLLAQLYPMGANVYFIAKHFSLMEY